MSVQAMIENDVFYKKKSDEKAHEL